jgi:hypothetical protein
VELEEARRRARAILGKGDAGQKELLEEIREGLITALLLEREAGENPKESGKSTEGNARQSRKQFKEIAELLMELMGDD